MDLLLNADFHCVLVNLPLRLEHFMQFVARVCKLSQH
jgi:hypothetical protein